MKICGILGRIISALIQKQKPVSTTEKKTEKKGETHRVAGTDFRQDVILSMGVKNDDYTKTKKTLQAEGRAEEWIYEYKFYPVRVELVPEPENPQDPKAIKVMVDGLHVGYIKAGSCGHVRKLLESNRIESITCKIGGGRSKLLTYDDDEKLIIEKDDIPFWVRLTINTKPEN